MGDYQHKFTRVELLHARRLALRGLPKLEGDFVAAKALNFNKIQESSIGEPRTIQRQLLRITKNP